jgi:predicted nucleic-acid-binding Zn-ribbon protein
MKRAIFRCKRCGYEGRVDVFSPDDVEERRRKGLPVPKLACPACGSSEYELRQ